MKSLPSPFHYVDKVKEIPNKLIDSEKVKENGEALFRYYVDKLQLNGQAGQCHGLCFSFWSWIGTTVHA